MKTTYHITTKEIWNKAVDKGTYGDQVIPNDDGNFYFPTLELEYE